MSKSRLLLLAISMVLHFDLLAQKEVTGRYIDHFANEIVIRGNNTFVYKFDFDLIHNWAEGTWTLNGDTLYLQMIPVYDTITSLSTDGTRIDSLVLSADQTIERISEADYVKNLISSDTQVPLPFPKLLFKKSRLHKIKDGKVLKSRQRASWQRKKWRPWFSKTN